MEERKDAALSPARFWLEVREAVRRVGMLVMECWLPVASPGVSWTRYGDAFAFFFFSFLEVSLKFVSFFIHEENGRRRPGRSGGG